jgi:uncharacterized protein
MDLLIPAAIGIVAGLAGGLLGIGGSVIIIPALILYLGTTPDGYQGHDQHLLQAAAMITNVFVAAPSVIAHYRAKAIVMPVVVVLIPTAVLGVLAGVAVSDSSAFARQNGSYLALILAAFLAYVACYNVWKLTRKTDLAREFGKGPTLSPWKIAAAGIPMGLTAGLLGIGGGAVCVPIQQVLLKIPLRRAIANSATTIVFSACIGAIHKNCTLASHGIDVVDSLRLAVMLIPTAILGSYFGGKLTHLMPKRALRVVFICFMAIISWVTFNKARAAIRLQSTVPVSSHMATPPTLPTGHNA